MAMNDVTGAGENIMSGHVWDLEERATVFALAVRAFIRRLPASMANHEDIKQLIRSSGSVPANYIEANKALGSKDRVMKLRISRKDAVAPAFAALCSIRARQRGVFSRSNS